MSERSQKEDESEKVELHDYIKFIKDEVRKSEENKPEEGFWIGAQSLEMTFQTTTEVSKEGGLKIYVVSAEGKKKQQIIQTVKISFVTQEFKPQLPIQALTGKGAFSK